MSEKLRHCSPAQCMCMMALLSIVLTLSSTHFVICCVLFTNGFSAIYKDWQ